MPPRQSFEQHCDPSVHLLPSVLHWELKAVHVLPAPHVPLQQSDGAWQERPSMMHAPGADGAHSPLGMHHPLQQSAPP